MLESPQAFTLRQGDVWTYRLDASDPDGDELLFTSDALPQGASLDAREGTLRWEVPFHLEGTQSIPVTVSSGGQATNGVISVEVLNANGAPSFDIPCKAGPISEGQSLVIQAFAFDPDHPGV